MRTRLARLLDAREPRIVHVRLDVINTAGLWILWTLFFLLMNALWDIAYDLLDKVSNLPPFF